MRYALSVPSELQTGLQSGASIAVLGVCQTVVAINGNEIIFEAIEETLKCTTLSSLHKGQWVNFERSAKMGDEIGGHPLAGHVLGTATIKSIDYPSAEQRTLRIACDPKWMKNIFPKGFIALNGASLTVGETDPQGFLTVHLIPETLKRTTFGAALVGDQINVEIDSQTQAIVATVERILAEKLAFSN
jgi:riboflavin synthase